MNEAKNEIDNVAAISQIVFVTCHIVGFRIRIDSIISRNIKFANNIILRSLLKVHMYF